MIAIDGQSLFASGPHTLQPRSWERQLQRRALPGLDGELVLDQGLRSRVLIQMGRLQAATSDTLVQLIAQAEAMIDGRLHTVTDGLNRTFRNILVERFEPTAPIRRGRGYWCEYTVQYRQMP